MTGVSALVFGAGGALGRALVWELAARGIPHTALDRAACDFTHDDAVARALDRHAPGLVFNAAAYTAVDLAETDSQRATELNARAPGRLARRLAASGVRFVHYSTDFVFDGGLERPYLESDAPRPLNVYGRTKLAGEHAVLEAHPAAVVLRTAWLYGAGGRNFPSRLATELRGGRTVCCERDRKGSPTWTGALARASLDAAVGAAAGVVHAACVGPTDWWTFAIRLAGRLGVDPGLVQVLSAGAAMRPAVRPGNSALASERFETLGLSPMPTWEIAQDAAMADADARGAAGR